jgi:RND family efflux transporter MFP subunit
MITRIKSALFLAVLIWAWTSGPSPCSAAAVEAISTPSANITLSFVMTGQLVEVLVKEGDSVKKGELLATLDDRTERIQVQELKAEAADKTRIKAAKAELAQKKVDLEKLEAARIKGAVTDWEFEHARLNVRIAELSLQSVILEHEQNKRRYAQALSQIKRMRLIAPIEGSVEKVIVEPGEATKPLGPVVQLIKIDPLWVDVPVPLSETQKLALGQIAPVKFPGVESVKSADGRIIHISSVVDAASDTLRVRVEVPNPDGRPAGERVTVEFPDSSQATDQEGVKSEVHASRSIKTSGKTK